MRQVIAGSVAKVCRLDAQACPHLCIDAARSRLPDAAWALLLTEVWVDYQDGAPGEAIAAHYAHRDGTVWRSVLPFTRALDGAVTWQYGEVESATGIECPETYALASWVGAT
jgi:hypothetical protein